MAIWGREGFFQLIALRPFFITEGSQGRNPETRTEAETMEEHYLLACSLACSICLPIHSRTICPRVTPFSVDWALSHQLLMKKIPHRFASRQSDGVIFSIELSSQIILACVILTRKQTKIPTKLTRLPLLSLLASPVTLTRPKSMTDSQIIPILLHTAFEGQQSSVYQKLAEDEQTSSIRIWFISVSMF